MYYHRLLSSSSHTQSQLGLLYLRVQFILPKKHTPVPHTLRLREGTQLQTHMDRLNDQTTLTASKNKLAYCTIDIDGVVSSVFQSPAFIGSSIRQLNVFNDQFTICFCCNPCPRCRINLLTFVIEPT